MRPAAELAKKLYDAAAYLKIAIASEDAETIREAQQRASDLVCEVYARGIDGGLSRDETVRLMPLMHSLGCLVFASVNPELVCVLIPTEIASTQPIACASA